MTNSVIRKFSRSPANESYSGPSWDSAGIRDRWKPVYISRAEAEELARLLAEVNPVGFQVSEMMK